jgi:hypothetical protein
MAARGSSQRAQEGNGWSPAAWQAILDEARAEAGRLQRQVTAMTGTMLTGGEATLLGKPARVTLEWPRGLPGGMTEADVRRLGEKMLAEAAEIPDG